MINDTILASSERWAILIITNAYLIKLVQVGQDPITSLQEHPKASWNETEKLLGIKFYQKPLSITRNTRVLL